MIILKVEVEFEVFSKKIEEVKEILEKVNGTKDILSFIFNFYEI